MRQLVTPPRVVREYETIFIVRPDVSDDDKSKVIDRFEGIIESLEGRLLKREDWGKRRLAYRIQHNSHGIYYYYQYVGFNDLVGELERNLRILEPVLKYLTVKLGDDVDVDKRVEAAAAQPTPVLADEPTKVVLATDDDDRDGR